MRLHLKRLAAACAGLVLALAAGPIVGHAADVPNDGDGFSTVGTTLFYPPVPLTAGSGVWTFGANGICFPEGSAGIEIDLNEIAEFGVNCNVVGSGNYQSTACGTMQVEGTFDVTLFLTVPFVTTETWTTTFTADIAGFHGVFNLGSASLEGATSDGDTDNNTPWPTGGRLAYYPTDTGGACMRTAITDLGMLYFETTIAPI